MTIDPEDMLDMLEDGGTIDMDGFIIESVHGRDKQFKVTYQQQEFHVGPNEAPALARLGTLCHALGERRQS